MIEMNATDEACPYSDEDYKEQKQEKCAIERIEKHKNTGDQVNNCKEDLPATIGSVKSQTGQGEDAADKPVCAKECDKDKSRNTRQNKEENPNNDGKETPQ
jgi:hypothetical protein